MLIQCVKLYNHVHMLHCVTRLEILKYIILRYILYRRVIL